MLDAAVATEVLIDAIARSDGSRASVINALRRSHLRSGIAGDLSFDRFGDPESGTVAVYRLRRHASTPREHEIAGLVFDRVIEVRRSQLDPTP